MDNNKKYYSYRKGEKEGNIRLVDLKQLIKVLYEKYNEKGDFEYEFGYYDFNHYYRGNKGMKMGEDILITFPGRKIWPIEKNYLYYDENTCFDLLEYFYDNICKNNFRKWYYDLDELKNEGKKEFREEVNNKILSKYKNSKYELMANGEIYVRVSEHLRKIVFEHETSSNEFEIEEKINRAKKNFFHYNSNIDDKRDAIRTLADVLEFIRADVKENLLRKDEGRLFQIANEFSFRHHNYKQHTDYAEDIWFEWIFFCYLNTINTMVKIIEKQG